MTLRSAIGGLGLVVAAVGSAQAAQIDISTLVNSDLTTYSGGSNYPQNGGPLTVAGVDFQLATGGNGNTAVIQGSIDFNVVQTYTIAVNLAGMTVVDTLINSAFGGLGTNIGSLVFHGSLGDTFTYNLVEGTNVRDHFEGSFVNTATDLAGTANFGDTDRLDMQTILLPDVFATEVLTSVDFNSFGQGGFGAPFLAAIDAFAAPTPIPAVGLPGLAIAFGGLLSWMRRRKAARA
jgi:hypothetical protein